MTVVTTLSTTWPSVQPDRTSLLDPACGPKQTEGSRVMFEFKVDSCGTRNMVQKRHWIPKFCRFSYGPRSDNSIQKPPLFSFFVLVTSNLEWKRPTCLTVLQPLVFSDLNLSSLSRLEPNWSPVDSEVQFCNWESFAGRGLLHGLWEWDPP